MTAQFLIDMDESIVSKARTPKGMRTLQAILDATYVLISTEGVAAASQEAIAKRANLTQSAVRYYFPKKEHLLYAFFYANIKRLEAQFEEELAKTDRDARSQLMRIVTLHCERILAVEDVFYFEAANYWARNTGYRQLRNDWYKTAVSYGRCNIQSLIIERRMLKMNRRPMIHYTEADKERCAATAFQIITLTVGGWSSMGSSRAVYPKMARKHMKAMLLDGIERLIA